MHSPGRSDSLSLCSPSATEVIIPSIEDAFLNVLPRLEPKKRLVVIQKAVLLLEEAGGAKEALQLLLIEAAKLTRQGRPCSGKAMHWSCYSHDLVLK